MLGINFNIGYSKKKISFKIFRVFLIFLILICELFFVVKLIYIKDMAVISKIIKDLS